ncbi:MAG: methyltransferase domain-containing protein [Ilumatobacteraceae bacterium]
MDTNRFDTSAATWDDPAKIERAAAVATKIRSTVQLDRSMRLLEYGAGTGLVTQALRDAVGPVTLADTSTGMRDVMRSKIASGALTDARVWDLDLATDPVPDERFDLIVSVLTMHHIENTGAVLAGFATLLDDNGTLCVVDLDKEDGSFHGADFEGHRGFDRSALSADLAVAGFTDVVFQDCHHIVHGEVDYPLFLVSCKRTRVEDGQQVES